MIISVVTAKIWYLKNVWILLGHPADVYVFLETAFVFCQNCSVLVCCAFTVTICLCFLLL